MSCEMPDRPPPRVPPAKVVDEDATYASPKDKGDAACVCPIPETGLPCTRVALYDLVFENGCVHTEPYSVCLLHKDLWQWALDTETAEIACRKCDPPLLLGKSVKIQLLRDYGK